MTAYTMRRHHHASAFLLAAEGWLLRDEARNNLILSLAERLTRPHRYDPPLYFGVLHQGDDIVGCALRTPPFKLLLTDLPLDSAETVAADVASVYTAVPAVLGPAPAAERIAALLANRQHGRMRPGMRQRIYEMRNLIPLSAPPSGFARVAEPADTPLVTEWIDRFARDANVTGYVRAAPTAEDRIMRREIFLWIDDVPVAMAGWSGTTPNGVRIGYVYTPAELRGRGYGSAVTAAATQMAFDAGYRFCFLFTDLSNPTSNSIYQKIGYEPIADVSDHLIDAAC